MSRLKNLEGTFSVSKAALIVGFFTLFGKFVALARENIFATVFGQNRILDTYYAAFRIPDFITNLFILSTLSVAFLPIFTGILTRDKNQANEFANNVLNVLILGIGGLSLLLLAFSAPLVHWLAPGFYGEQYATALQLTRLILLSPIIHALSTLFGGILNAKKKFFITSIAPIFYNFGIIGGVLFLYPRFGIMGVGYGVIAGALIQAIIQIVASVKLGFSWRPILNPKQSSMRELARLYAPRIFAFDLSNVTLILGTIIGSRLVEGSISALNQAFNLQSVPVGVFAYALAITAFPVLSEFFALKDEVNYIKMLGQTLRQLLFFIIPTSVLLLLLRAYVVRLILGRGNFTWEDTIMTFSILGIFSFSLFSQSLTTVLSRAFYARLNTKTPVAINIFSIIMNIALTYAFGYHFGIQGITAAFVIASIINALLLFLVLRNELHKANSSQTALFDSELLSSTAKIILSSIFMGLIVYGFIYLVGPLVNTRTTFGILLQSGAATVAGVAVYLLMGKILKLPEAERILLILRKKNSNEPV